MLIAIEFCWRVSSVFQSINPLSRIVILRILGTPWPIIVDYMIITLMLRCTHILGWLWVRSKRSTQSLWIISQFKKVQYSDAGLGQITIKTQKMRNFRDLSEVNDQIKLIADKDNGWRQFLEFKDTQDGEVVITIEYWYIMHSHSVRTAPNTRVQLGTLNRNTLRQLRPWSTWFCKIFPPSKST